MYKEIYVHVIRYIVSMDIALASKDVWDGRGSAERPSNRATHYYYYHHDYYYILIIICITTNNNNTNNND